jgi:hypothetical protein
MCRSALPFYSLTLTPEDKVRIHQEIFQLVYHGNGGFTHDEVYTMPIFLRYFYLKLLIQQKEKENETTNDEPDGVVKKSPARPAIPKKPF